MVSSERPDLEQLKVSTGLGPGREHKSPLAPFSALLSLLLLLLVLVCVNSSDLEELKVSTGSLHWEQALQSALA